MFKDKGVGFYVTGGVALLSLVAAIVCAATSFAALAPIGSAIAFLVIGACVALVFLIVPTVISEFVKSGNAWLPLTSKALMKIAPFILLVFSLLALMPLASSAYTYITANATSKDMAGIIEMVFESGIVADVIFILITAIASTVAVFLPFFKKNAEESRSEPKAKNEKAKN